jgi:hypothetical protein
VFFGYAFTRILSTPLDNQDVGNWACTLGMAALSVEAVLVAVAAYTISIRRAVSPQNLGITTAEAHVHDAFSTRSSKEVYALGFEDRRLSEIRMLSCAECTRMVASALADSQLPLCRF